MAKFSNVETNKDGDVVKYEREGFTLFKMFYKTLRVNSVGGHWWSRGQEAVAVITARCNLHCEYCPTLILGTTGRHPVYKECTLEEWKTFFERHYEWLSHIYISGGEPSLIPWVSDLINWLVDKGHHVTLLTNLYKPENLMGIKKHWRFVCCSTYHETADPKQYEAAYYQLKDRFRIIPQEIVESEEDAATTDQIRKLTNSENPGWRNRGKRFEFSRTKEYFTLDWLKIYTRPHFLPDSPRTKLIRLGSDLYK